MKPTPAKPTDAECFAQLLKKASFSGHITLGPTTLAGRKGVRNVIQYNRSAVNLLRGAHEYTFPVTEGELQVSVQLYLNSSNHYRLFCYTRLNGRQGMTFSLNLTTGKSSATDIPLTQKLRFTERFNGDEKLTSHQRKQKQARLCYTLREFGFTIPDTEINLGNFNPATQTLSGTTPEKFLHDFLAVSILKGHYQGNKGYRLPGLDS